ncbi:MAG: tetratricopeptide repeat protein [Myxococcales bacterium]|nr:tetratricopeptide repeat protein [Myxococcales bacterium]
MCRAFLDLRFWLLGSCLVGGFFEAAAGRSSIVLAQSAATSTQAETADGVIASPETSDAAASPSGLSTPTDVPTLNDSATTTSTLSGRTALAPDDVASSSKSVDNFGEAEAGAERRVGDGEYQPLRPPTTQDIDQSLSKDNTIKLLEKELKYYERGVDSFASGQKSLIYQRYEKEKLQLDSQYERRIEELEADERSLRTEAIDRFEVFVKKYPNDPIYTPDAMFRLAELHYEKSSDDFLQESRAYEDRLSALEDVSGPELEAPEPNFDKTIALHRTLLQRFPRYRLADAARYLLGYAYGEMGETNSALVAFEDLVESHPESQFIPEVWTRIGEIYFDGNSEKSLAKAVYAYQQVVSFGPSAYYDKALYKLAWTYYRLDQYDASIDSFVALVHFADEQKAKTGSTGSELRSEAIQYIAISLADEKWGDFTKARSRLLSIDKETFAQDIWGRYGDVLFEQTRYEEAISALQYMIQRYPRARGNPEAQVQIVRAYEQLRDFDAATKARERLVKDYGAGSSWIAANAGDQEALVKARSLTEKSLYTAALFRHQQAQSLRSQGKGLESIAQYRAAATAYQDYLTRFPDSNRAYDFDFYLAETLYYSEAYEQAAEQYAKVRDSAIDNKHLAAAALYAVLSHEQGIESLENKGEIPTLKVLKAEERKALPVSPKPLPPARQALVDASDRFLVLVTSGENRAAIEYRAAQEFYKHDRFDEARSRFEEIIKKYPDHTVAEFSANLIIESYLASEEWDKVDQWSGRIIEIAQRAAQSGTRGKKLVSALGDVRLRAKFKLAEQLNTETKYEEAALAYVDLVDANPQSDVADKALFNAAVAYEQANRFDAASKTYWRISRDYPGSELAPRSLFRVGISAEKGFDFPTAIEAYQTLVKKYPKAEERADALFNVAVVLEHMQRYPEAARAYRRYAVVFPNRADSGDVYFRSALVYEKMEKWEGMVATLSGFVKKHKKAPQQRERLVRAYLKMGEAEAKRGRLRASRGAFGRCVALFKRLRLSVESLAGGYAAQCSFELAEFVFDDYDKIAISGSEREQVEALKKKARVQVRVQQAYADVFAYKRLEQTVAASFRIGHSYDRFAEALFTAPVPKSLDRNPDLADAYRVQLEDQAAILESNAEDAYRKAYQEARRGGINNQWTQRILEGLHKFAPNEFPIQKQGKPALQKDLIFGNGLDSMVQWRHFADDALVVLAH